ncbi:hypothetical protein OG613_48895 (plasmid) [Streptomyces sp. NBC_00015]|uniref:hypothetical protein n=1 Tax=Streptomyces sp. NBC_00015 TaxID=2903611 RepID=UPI002F9124C5
MTTLRPRPATVTVHIEDTPAPGTLPANIAAFLEQYPSAAPALEAIRARYNPTPEQEQAAYEYAVSAISNPAPDITLADVYAIANGQYPLH